MITIKKTGLFLENEIDLALFTTLTDENLLSIGVLAFGARKIMTNAMKGRIFFLIPGNVSCIGFQLAYLITWF